MSGIFGGGPWWWEHLAAVMVFSSILGGGWGMIVGLLVGKVVMDKKAARLTARSSRLAAGRRIGGHLVAADDEQARAWDGVQ